MASAPAGKAIGIDISYAQAAWPGIASDKFVVIRVSSGDGGLHRDPLAAQHIAEARKAGKPFALYHYLGSSGGVAEASYAVKTMEGLGVWGHKLFCDFEGDADVKEAEAFIAHAKKLMRPEKWRFRLRKRVGLYSGYKIKANGNGTLGADFGWLADYDAFDRPSGWSRRFTRLWQYASTSSRGNLDLDAYMGRPALVGRFFRPIRRSGKLAK